MNVKSHSIVGWELSWSEIDIRKIEQVILIKSDCNKDINSMKWVNDDTSNSSVTDVFRRKEICVAKVII